jgi:hypothetical protein
MTTATAESGSVSSATMRPADLIPRFFDVLDELRPDRAAMLRGEYGVTSETDFERWCDPNVDPGVYDRQDLYDLKDEKAVERRHFEVDWLLGDLFNWLDECAPENHYFGSHPGDGADYGFWESED